MAKLLKHFGIGGKKYNPSSSQQTDYSSASLKSNSVNELACNTKYCSNNCLSGNTPASINTKHKGCSNSKSDYDTRSLKLRSDECNKKQKPPSSTTEKFKALGRSSKETTQYSSKTVKSKSREGETKSKHKKISFSNLIHSADHHHTKVASIDASEASSPIVPEILEEYSNPLDLALEKDPLTIDDDYSTPYDQVDKFLADAKNSKKEMPNGIVTVINRTKNSTNTRNVPKVISVKPINNNNTSSNHTTSTTTTTTPTNIKTTTNTTITTHTNTATLNNTAALISTSNNTSTTTAPSTTNTSSTTSSSTIPTTSTTSNTDEQNIEGDEVMKEMVIKKNDEVKGDDALCLSGGDVSKTIGGDGGVALGLNNEDEVVVLGDDDVVVSKSESVVVRSDGGNDDDEEDDDDDGIKKIAPEEITNDNDDTTKKLSGDDDDDNNTAALLATDPMVGSQSYGTSGGSVTVVTTNNYHDLKPVIVLSQLQIDQSDHFIAPSNNQSNNSATLSNNKSISTTATTCQKTLDLKAANETKEDSNQSERLLRHNNQSGVATSRPKSDGVLIAPGRNKSYTKNRNNNNNINNINNNIVNKFSNNIRIAKKKTSLEASKTLNKNHTTSNHQKLLHTTTTSHHNHSLSSSHHHSNSHQNHHPHHNSSSQNHSVAQNTIHNHSSNHHNHTNHSHSSDSDSIEAPLEQNNWFHGCISRLDAEKLLSKQSTGTYLVRVSESNNNDFSLSLKSRSGFLHIKIVQDTTTFQYILGQFSQPFKHICVLVEHYTTNQLPIKGNDGLTLSNPLVVAVEVGGGGGA